MIHEKDPNVLYTLLSVLRSLPTAIWTGTAPESDLIGKSKGLPETLETLETLAPLQSTLAPPTSPTADDPFHDVFGPFERGSTSHSPDDYVTPSGSLGLSNVSTSPKAASQTPHLPPLFDEEEVGTIVGFLRSEDSTLREGVRVVPLYQRLSSLTKLLRPCVFFSVSTHQKAELSVSTSARSWKESQKLLRSKPRVGIPPMGS